MATQDPPDATYCPDCAGWHPEYHLHHYPSEQSNICSVCGIDHIKDGYAYKNQNEITVEKEDTMDTTPVMKNITLDGGGPAEDRAVASLPVETDSSFLREKALLLAMQVKEKNLATNLDLTALTKMIHNWLLKGTL